MSPASILNANPGGENIISGKTQLYAGGGIGTEDNPIISNVGYLEGFSGGAQGIYLVNHGKMETGDQRKHHLTAGDRTDRGRFGR
jgi:hypothetical protein